MSSMFFGHYLLENGIIDREALLDAIERQRRTNRSLPEIAVEEKLLAVEGPFPHREHSPNHGLRNGDIPNHRNGSDPGGGARVETKDDPSIKR